MSASPWLRGQGFARILRRLMSFVVDHVVIAVADLEAATQRYSLLLGRRPSWFGAHPTFGTRNALFRLDNTYVELLAADAAATSVLAEMLRADLGERSERPFMIAVGMASIDTGVAALRAAGSVVSDPFTGEGIDDGSGVRRTWRNAMLAADSSRGLRLLLIEHLSSPELLPMAAPVAEAHAVCSGVDHLVVFSPTATTAAEWWSTSFAARPQTQQTFAERGTLNVLVEVGDIVLEFIQPANPKRPLAHDRFWGIAYRVADLEAAVERLRAAGLAADPPRSGLAAGTRVATVRWDGVPTLLIERRQ